MADLLKNLYSDDFFETLTQSIDTVVEGFEKSNFLADVYDSDWENRELKQRMRHISTVLKKYLSKNFEKSSEQLLDITAYLQALNRKELNFPCILIPDYIEQNGLDHFETSVKAFEKITMFISCEFAVRPFIIKYKKQMLDFMLEWTRHESEHVRRLASEGSRPRLPWAMALPDLKKNPSPILPILEELKSDSSEYVRKSVANSLNDISKDNPELLIEIAQKWIGKTKETDWIVKHACRTLLKAGNTQVLEMFGLGSVEKIRVPNFQIKSEIVEIGNDLFFSFDLHNQSEQEVKIRLEYGIYYQKKNGTLSRKVFKISEKIYPPKSGTTISRKQSFKLISTRKYHEGKHKVALIINGIEFEKIEFILIK